MARFRATIQGQRGEASRLGSPKTGIQARINGWEAGVEVAARAVGDTDVFNIFATNGSNGSRSVYLGHVISTANGPQFVPGSK